MMVTRGKIMKQFLLTVLFLACISSIFTTEFDFCDSTVIVVLRPEYSDFNTSRSADFFGSFEKESVENIFLVHSEAAIQALNKSRRGSFRSIYKITLPTNDKSQVLAAIEELNQIEGVEYAQANYYIPLALIPNDEYWNHLGLWALHGEHGVKAPEAWDISTGSHEVRVGVVDTGIASHPDLNDNLDADAGWNFASNNANASDPHSHGTRSAGVIGAVGNNSIGTVGINWNVTLIPLKITVGNAGSTSTDVMVSAINFATNTWGTPDQISVLNMSFSGYGTNSSTNVRDAINNYPGLFTWSAGNNGANVDNNSNIASFNLGNLIAVGAIDINGERSVWNSMESSAYSSSTQYVHVFAPGTDGYTTSINNGYQSYGGTSMAAPHAAGVAALLLSINPMLTSEEIKEAITNNYDPITISTPAGQLDVKRLNAFKAADAVMAFENDLEAVSITGALTLSQFEPSNFTIRVRNRGVNPATGYFVQLMRAGVEEPLAIVSGTDLASRESRDYTFTWTPMLSGQFQLSGRVVWEPDENIQNNQTRPHNIRVLLPGQKEVVVGEPSSPLVSREGFIDYWYQDSITQMIYLEEELELGTISHMTVRFTGSGNIPGNVMIRLLFATTEQSQFTNNTSWIPFDQFEEVFYGSLWVTNNGTYSITINLHNTFDYEGGNLVVMAIKDHNQFYGQSGSNAFQFSARPSGYRTIYWRSDTAGAPPTSPLPNAAGRLQSIANATFLIQTGNIHAPLIAPGSLQAEIVENDIKIQFQHQPSPQTTFLHFEIERNEEFLSQTNEHAYIDVNPPVDTGFVYRVRAVYEEGNSAWVNTENVFIPIYNPPTDLLATGLQNAIYVSWNPPTTQNYGNIDGYIIERDDIPLDLLVTDLFYEDTDVVNGVLYNYRVKAVYSGEINGESEYSNLDSAYSLDDIIPPAFITAELVDNAIVVSWGVTRNYIQTGRMNALRTESVGRVFQYFELHRNGIKIEETPETSYTDNDLLVDVTIVYQVRSVYSTGTSDWVESNPLFIPIFNTVNDLTAEIIIDGVKLSWDLPEVQNHGIASSYRIIKDDVTIDTVTGTEYIDNAVNYNTEYSYAIVVKYDNPEGESLPVYTSVKTPQPSHTSDLEVSLGLNGVEFTWSEINSTFGTVTGFTIYKNETIIVANTNESYIDFDVTFNKLYTYEVTANYINPTAVESIGLFNVETPMPAPIKNLVAEVQEENIYLSWDIPESNFGTLSGYRISRNDIYITTVDTNEFIDSGLDLIMLYHYTIVVEYINPSGESEPVSTDVTNSFDDPIVPLNTALMGNYPNPFNPETTIMFSLATDSRVKIDVYDIRGRLVRSLVNNDYNAGVHSVIFNGLDNNGQNIGSGVYFYRMNADESSSIRRMILMK